MNQHQEEESNQPRTSVCVPICLSVLKLYSFSYCFLLLHAARSDRYIVYIQYIIYILYSALLALTFHLSFFPNNALPFHLATHAHKLFINMRNKHINNIMNSDESDSCIIEFSWRISSNQRQPSSNCCKQLTKLNLTN